MAKPKAKRATESALGEDTERLLAETAVQLVLGKPRASVEGPPPSSIDAGTPWAAVEGIPPSVRLGLAPSLEHLGATSLPLQGVALGKVQSSLVDLVAAQMATQYSLPMAWAIEAMLDSQTKVVNTVFAGMTKVAEAQVSQVNAISQIIATAIDRDVLGQFGSLIELANGFKGRGRYTFRPELETWLRRLDEEYGGRWMDVADEAEKAAGIASGQLAVESQVRESAGLHEAAVYETIRSAAPDIADEIDAEAEKAPQGQRDAVRQGIAVTVAALIVVAYVTGAVLHGTEAAILLALLNALGLNVREAYKALKGPPRQ